ncbi:MAG TPA: tyrosine-type recombinase/integrase, partial [Spirochaetia bacterium]|nr:tyrosine-type recombinase/integrase [Spirochaetia bacterium]
MVPEQLLLQFEDYLTAGLRLSRQTVATYLRDCRGFVTWATANELEPRTVTTAEIIDFLIMRQQDEGIDQRTIAKTISALRSLFAYLVLEKAREDNPATLIELPRASHRVPGVLEIEEIERLLAAIEIDSPLGLRDRALFELIYSCGLRISEAVELSVDRLFLAERIIRVQGKGDKERLVPMGEHAHHWMTRYLKDARPHLARRPVAALFL